VNATATTAGLEDFDQDDMVVPRRVLVQPTTKTKELGISKAMPGSFLDKASKTLYNEPLEIVILAIKKDRALSHDFGSGEQGYRCWSKDGKSPDADVENPLTPTGLCKDCDYKDKDLQYNLLCMDVKETKDAGVPQVFWFTARKSSSFPVKQLTTAWINRRKAPKEYVVTMEGVQSNSKKGNFYVVNFRDVTVLPDSLVDDVEAAYSLYASRDAGAVSDEDTAESVTPF
jgi:hypothetical protein